jgi:hypothetical protein
MRAILGVSVCDAMTNISDDDPLRLKRKLKKPNEPITIDTIEDGLDRVALAMEKAGPRGEVYLPIYERLEAELAKAKERDDRLQAQEFVPHALCKNTRSRSRFRAYRR